MNRSVLLQLAALLAVTAASGAIADDDGRARIAEERSVVKERHAAAVRECAQRFAVTACMDEAKARKRTELAPLRDRELRIDEAERQRRAQQRREAIAAKQAAAATRPPAGSAPTLLPIPAPGVAASAAPHAERPQVKLRDHAAAQAAAAAERARAAERRREEARQTQARIARRLAEQAARGKKPQALPTVQVPASAPR
ncbi:conserved exported hypothetical protein [Rubrivivax sp. A210]|uniref:hypothetical protein n=1 Tax=Rubrivivax sp. A210 TaxID=2772301 RepID=UPI001918FD6B|nr:hypothetical protein [Rubrivivax sp. A210]CAD5367360.1 conserved exported hypothetical protein [Rubrivivax sp. A210]